MSFYFCAAQTKLISHKSHSGSNATFNLALKHNSDLLSSNFGQAPNPTIRIAELDSLIFLNDTTVVMVTTESCTNRWIENADTTIWKEGKDTVFHHPLFHLQNDLDSVKKNLKNEYFFKNDIDNVTFVGYDNGESISKKEKRKTKKEAKKNLKKKRKNKKEKTKVKTDKIEDKEIKIQNPTYIKKRQDRSSAILITTNNTPPNPPKGPIYFLLIMLLSIASILGIIHYQLKIRST